MGSIKSLRTIYCNIKTSGKTLQICILTLWCLLNSQSNLLAMTGSLTTGSQISTSSTAPLLSNPQQQQIMQAVEQIRKKTRTPGLSIGITFGACDHKKDVTETWQYQSGVSDIKSNSPLESHHLFRTGSVSKLVVAIAIMQLIEKQQFTLQSKVKDLLPDLFFINQWQNTEPLLVAHLLNHSSGWDAPHFAANIPQSNGFSNQEPIAIQDTLNLHPHTRESRWPPGSRTAYNNTGYLVLAAIIEKVTEMSFEQYVQQHIFAPLNMSSSDYFYTDFYAQNAVTHYKGRARVNYAHINNRASGALNSHVSDLLKLVKMMMSQQGDNVLTFASKQRMMSPSFSRYSVEGVKLGWGFGMSLITRGNIVWFAQEGSLPGASAFVGWNTELQIGIAILTNNNGPAIPMLLNKIGELLAAPVDRIESDIVSDQQHLNLTGYYKALNPVSSKAEIINVMPWKLTVRNQQAMIKPLLGAPRELLAGENGGFLHPITKEKVLVPGEDQLVGNVLYYGPQTLKKVSAVHALTPLLSIVMFALNMLVTSILALIWLPIWIRRRKTTMALTSIQKAHRLLPLLNLVLLILTAAIITSGFGSATPFTLFGQITLHSVTLFLFSMLVPLLVIAHLVLIIMKHKNIPKKEAKLAGTLSSFTGYLHVIFGIPFIIIMASFGYVGFISWL